MKLLPIARKVSGLKILFFLFALSLSAPLRSEEFIEDILFQGNRSFKSRLLSGIVSSRKNGEFSLGRLRIDVKSLEGFYHREGFLSAKAEARVKEGKKGKVVTFVVAEGVRSSVDSIIFLGKKDAQVERILRKEGYGFYSERRVKRLWERLREFYLNSGYYYVDLEVDTSLQREGGIALIVKVEEGALAYLKEIRFRGLRRVRYKDALRTTELKVGEKYSQKRLYEAARRLYATRMFEDIYFKVYPIAGEEESLEVRFFCQEAKERIFGFGLGYSSPPQRTYHSLSFEHLNLLRRLHSFQLLSEISPDWKGSYNLVVRSTYRVPYISRTKINFILEPFFALDRDKRAAKEVWELGVETGFYYDLSENLQANIGSRYRTRSGTQVHNIWGGENSTPARRAEGLGSTITNSLNLKLLYDTRDDFFSPSSGLYSFSFGEYAGGLLGGRSDFYRLTQEFRLFFSLTRLTKALRLGLGKIIPHGRTVSVPDYEKFYLGGMTTLRGYDEKALKGDWMVLLNLESRFPIYKVLSGVLFWDIGFVKGGLGIESNTGVGIRVASPIGPLRFDYAVVPKRRKEKNWWKANVGLGQVF